MKWLWRVVCRVLGHKWTRRDTLQFDAVSKELLCWRCKRGLGYIVRFKPKEDA